MSAPDVSVRTTISADPLDIWAAVADPRRLTEWSPDSTAVRCSVEGPLPVGVSFSGSNRNGLFRWSTISRVVESDPGRSFAFDVSFLGLAVSRWRYELTVGPSGVEVQEQWWDRRGPVMTGLGLVGTGVANRREYNEAGMRVTLAALKAGLEGPSERA
jgi:uncharacterized protein YndB with AHSA1/START domain